MPPAVQAIGSLVLMLIVCVLVILAAYYTTRLMGKKMAGRTTGSGCMKVVDRLALGPDRSLVLVKVADKTMLLGVTQHHIETICDIDAAQLPEQTQPEPADPFVNVLQNLMRKNGLVTQPKKDEEQDGR